MTIANFLLREWKLVGYAEASTVAGWALIVVPEGRRGIASRIKNTCVNERRNAQQHDWSADIFVSVVCAVCLLWCPRRIEQKAGVCLLGPLRLIPHSCGWACRGRLWGACVSGGRALQPGE